MADGRGRQRPLPRDPRRYGMDQRVSFGALLDRYRRALDHLEKVGVRISPHSRLRSYERRLDSLAATPLDSVDVGFLEQVIFDLREIDEIAEISEDTSTKPTPQESERLRLLGKGHEHPDPELAASASRDLQFELYLKAIFRRAGLDARCGDPDVFIRVGGTDFPVEAKRPKSPKTLDGNLRDAARKLSAQSTPGVVALGADFLVRPRGHLLQVSDPQSLSASGNLLLDELSDRYANLFAKRLRRPNVLGLLLGFRIPAQMGGRPTVCSLVSRWHLDWSDPHRADGKPLLDAFEQAVPSLGR